MLVTAVVFAANLLLYTGSSQFDHDNPLHPTCDHQLQSGHDNSALAVPLIAI